MKIKRSLKNRKSFESSNWYIKIIRARWYIYALILYIKELLKVELWIEYILEGNLDKKQREKLRQDWKSIKRHVELTKMLKYKSKYGQERG